MSLLSNSWPDPVPKPHTSTSRPMLLPHMDTQIHLSMTHPELAALSWPHDFLCVPSSLPGQEPHRVPPPGPGFSFSYCVYSVNSGHCHLYLCPVCSSWLWAVSISFEVTEESLEGSLCHRLGVANAALCVPHCSVRQGCVIKSIIVELFLCFLFFILVPLNYSFFWVHLALFCDFILSPSLIC